MTFTVSRLRERGVFFGNNKDKSRKFIQNLWSFVEESTENVKGGKG